MGNTWAFCGYSPTFVAHTFRCAFPDNPRSEISSAPTTFRVIGVRTNGAPTHGFILPGLTKPRRDGDGSPPRDGMTTLYSRSLSSATGKRSPLGMICQGRTTPAFATSTSTSSYIGTPLRAASRLSQATNGRASLIEANSVFIGQPRITEDTQVGPGWDVSTVSPNRRTFARCWVLVDVMLFAMTHKNEPSSPQPGDELACFLHGYRTSITPETRRFFAGRSAPISSR